MRDVDHRVGAQRLSQRRHQERPAGLAEDVEHLLQLVSRGTGDGGQLVQPFRPADAAGVGAGVGQGLEEALTQPLLGRPLQLSKGLVGMHVERMRHATGRFIVGQREWAAGAGGLPVKPGAVQRMLQDRQLVGVVAHVIEQPGQQQRADLFLGHTGRSGDGSADLVTGQPGHQVLALVDGLGQAAKLGAITQKIRAHRQHHMDRHLGLRGGFQQQLHKGHGIVGRGVGGCVGRAAEAEQLLKLVHHHQQLGAGRQPRLLNHVHQAQAAQAQGEIHQLGRGQAFARHRRDGRRAVQHAGGRQRLRQLAQRVVLGPELRHAPGRTGAGHEAPVQRWPQAAVDER